MQVLEDEELQIEREKSGRRTLDFPLALALSVGTGSGTAGCSSGTNGICSVLL